MLFSSSRESTFSDLWEPSAASGPTTARCSRRVTVAADEIRVKALVGSPGVPLLHPSVRFQAWHHPLAGTALKMIGTQAACNRSPSRSITDDHDTTSGGVDHQRRSLCKRVWRLVSKSGTRKHVPRPMGSSFAGAPVPAALSTSSGTRVSRGPLPEFILVSDFCLQDRPSTAPRFRRGDPAGPGGRGTRMADVSASARII